MQRLSQLGVRNLRRRKSRYVLTFLGVTFGVAMVFGSMVASATTERAFGRQIGSIAGRADVSIRAAGSFTATLPARALDTYTRLPGVVDGEGIYGLRGTLRYVDADGT